MAIKPTQLPPPSDLTLDQNWVALKPGTYPVRTDLTPFKGTNLTNNELLDYHPKSPFGVGDSQSVVYVYPQGTIEVIGNVYCWNRLIKPGIYSQFEKIRYITNEEVLPRLEGVYSHHAPYNQTLRLQGPYVKRNTQGNEDILEYCHVSFDDAILQKNGNKVYPIPVLNGKLTIYPDGTFKTEGVVVKSTTKEIIQPYGYLADVTNYAYGESFINEVTKDDVNPKNVYKLVSENEDGSVTYEAINANKLINPVRPPMLPIGIIPINDGQVTVGLDGWVSLKGTVINSQGYLITADKFYYSDFCYKEEGVLIYNEKYLDKEKIYNPVIDVPVISGEKNETESQFKKVILNIADGAKDIYRYHPDNDSYECYTENLAIATYTRMKGWNTFVYNKPNDYTLTDLCDFFDIIDKDNNLLSESEIDKTYYPWKTKYSLKLGANFSTPKIRINEIGRLEEYLTIDHSVFWNPEELLPNPNNNYSRHDFSKYGLTSLNTDEGIELFLSQLPNKQNRLVDNIFYPYLTRRQFTHELAYGNPQPDEKHSAFKIYKNNDELYIKIEGNVIWKRGEEYFTLEEGEVKLDVDWPDIKEGSHYLFDVNGYFTDEPIFIKREGLTPGVIGNDLINIDGVKRQEEGLFKLVKRNVTKYLTEREKYYISNTRLECEVVFNDTTFKIEEHKGWYLDKVYTHRDTKGMLDYYTFRYNELLPLVLNADELYPNVETNTTLPSPDTRLYRFDKHQNRFSGYYNGVLTLLDTRYRVKWNKSNLIKSDSLPSIEYITPLPNKGTIRQQPELINTIKLDSSELYHNHEKGREQKPVFNLPEKWVASDGPLQVTVNYSNDTLFFYRVMDDIEYITGSFKANTNEIVNINIIPKHKYSYVEVWYDDPFEEQYHYNVKRTRIRKDRSFEHLVLTYPKKPTNRDNLLKGTGETFAKITLTDISVIPTKVIGETTVDKNNQWIFTSVYLEGGKRYRVTQYIEEFDLEESIEFDVITKELEENDVLTGLEMFGQDIYLIPFNYKNTRPELQEVDYQIRSSITWDIPNKTYTIHGLVGDWVNKDRLYKEGTYPIGILAPHYDVVIHDGNHLKQYQLDPSSVANEMRGRLPVYRITKNGYLAKVTNNNTQTSWKIGSRNLKEMHFLVSPRWKEEVTTLINDTTIVTDELLSSLSITKDMLHDFLMNPINYLVDGYNYDIVNGTNTVNYIRTSNVFVTRKDDYLVLEYDVPIFRLPLDNNYIYLGTPNVPGYALPENSLYTPSLFLKRLTRQKPWFMDYLGVENPNKPIIQYSGDVDKTKFTSLVSVLANEPVNGSVPVFKLYNKTNRINWRGEDPNGFIRTLVTPMNNVDNTISLSIYEIENWYDVSIEENIPTNTIRTHLIYLDANYGYYLDVNYNTKKPSDKMMEYVYNHWSNRGFNPNMFEFIGNNSTAWVKYHTDGITVTIHGRVRIDGRITKNITQTVTRSEDIQYALDICLNSYIAPGLVPGEVIQNDDDSITIKGYVVKVDADEQCGLTDYGDYINDDIGFRAILDEVQVINKYKNYEYLDIRRKEDKYTKIVYVIKGLKPTDDIRRIEIARLINTNYDMHITNVELFREKVIYSPSMGGNQINSKEELNQLLHVHNLTPTLEEPDTKNMQEFLSQCYYGLFEDENNPNSAIGYIVIPGGLFPPPINNYRYNVNDSTNLDLLPVPVLYDRLGRYDTEGYSIITNVFMVGYKGDKVTYPITTPIHTHHRIVNRRDYLYKEE